MAHDPSASVDVSADPDPGIRHAVSFGVVRRGYDPLQVDPVVADLAAQIDSWRAQADELREREADLLAALDAAEYRARRAEAAAEDLAGAVEAARATPTPAVDAGAAEPDDEASPADPAAGPEVNERVDAPTAGAPSSVSVGSGPDVATMVGEETARIIEAARHAAVEIGTRARDDAERIVSEAREEARSIRAEAEVQLLHRTREADDAVAARLLEAADAVQEAQSRAEAIVDDAFTEAATVVLRAREEADAAVAAGEEKGRELTDAAIAARDDLLADLVRRRKRLRRQVDQLEAGRVRLREAYAVVEAALSDATGELDRTVPEARDAALAAAERAETADDPELRAVVAALGADPDLVVGPAPADDPTAPDPASPTGTPVAARDDEPPPGATAPGPAGATDAPAALEAPDTPSDAVVATVEAEPEPQLVAAVTVTVDAPEPADGTGAVAAAVGEIDLRGTPAGSPVDAAVDDAAPTQEPATASAPDEPTGPAARRRRRRAPDPVEFEGRWSSAVRVLPPGTETADPAPPDGPDGSTPAGRGAPARTAPSATEVFARLRAGESHQPSLFDPSGADRPARDEPGLGDDAAPGEGALHAVAASPDPEAAWIARRDAAFAPALRALRRRLKATLADDEDSLLEAVRRSDPVPPTIDALRDARARRDDLAVALVASLATAAAAGTELAAAVPDAARATDGADGATVEVDEIAVELADAVVEPLDERLERCIARYHRSVAEDAADQTAAMASLVSSIKAAYRARRGAQVQVPTEHAVLLVGHRGLAAALRPGTPLRWVVAAPTTPTRRGGTAEHPAEAVPGAAVRVCTSCVAVADVGAGDPFGHGPLLPPARPGCRCAVAPVSAVVPRRP